MVFPNEETKFKTGESGNPNGRPPKLETVLKNLFLGEHNIRLSNSQITELLTVFLSKTKNELLELAKDESLPFWIELLVRKAAKDAKVGSIELLEKLLDRVFGKPKQLTEEVQTDRQIIINITTDEPKATD